MIFLKDNLLRLIGKVSFPFFRSDHPSHSRRIENFTFNQNYLNFLPDQSNLKWYAWRKLCFIKNSMKKLIYFSKWPIQSWSDRPVLTFEKHLKLPAQTKKIYLLIPDYQTVLSQALSEILHKGFAQVCVGGDCMIDYLQQEYRIPFSFMDLDYLGTLQPTHFCLWVQRNIQCICHEEIFIKTRFIEQIDFWAKQPDSFSTDGIILYQIPSWLP